MNQYSYIINDIYETGNKYNNNNIKYENPSLNCSNMSRTNISSLSSLSTYSTDSSYYIDKDSLTCSTLNFTYGASTVWASGTSSYLGNWQSPVISPGENIRRMIKARMSPAVHRRRTSLSAAMDIREERARRTLCRVIGEQAFKKFLRDGFITVVPKSGLTYRIYPGRGITIVYDRGIIVDRLCVVLQGDFPPTDSLLMRYLLILNDEGEFSKYAIKQTLWCNDSSALVFPAQEVKPLTDAWTALKVKVAQKESGE